MCRLIDNLTEKDKFKGFSFVVQIEPVLGETQHRRGRQMNHSLVPGSNISPVAKWI